MEYLFRSMERFTKGVLVFIYEVAMKLSSAPLGNMLMYPFKSSLECYPHSVIRDDIFFFLLYIIYEVLIICIQCLSYFFLD